MKTSPRIPVLIFTDKGKEDMEALSKVLTTAQELRDNLESLRYKPQKHSKRAGSSFSHTLESETILEELNMPELTESLITIWEEIHNNKERGTAFEPSYIADQLRESSGDGDIEDFQWSLFITSEEIQDLIERDWIELDEDILEEFREMSNDHGIEKIIYNHSKWITDAMGYEDRRDVPEPFLFKLADALDNNPTFFGERLAEALRDKLEAFKLAQDKLHQSLNAINNELSKLNQ